MDPPWPLAIALPQWQGVTFVLLFKGLFIFRLTVWAERFFHPQISWSSKSVLKMPTSSWKTTGTLYFRQQVKRYHQSKFLFVCIHLHKIIVHFKNLNSSWQWQFYFNRIYLLRQWLYYELQIHSFQQSDSIITFCYSILELLSFITTNFVLYE